MLFYVIVIIVIVIVIVIVILLLSFIIIIFFYKNCSNFFHFPEFSVFRFYRLKCTMALFKIFSPTCSSLLKAQIFVFQHARQLTLKNIHATA